MLNIALRTEFSGTLLGFDDYVSKYISSVHGQGSNRTVMLTDYYQTWFWRMSRSCKLSFWLPLYCRRARWTNRPWQ
jgi:hypothetical protein